MPNDDHDVPEAGKEAMSPGFMARIMPASVESLLSDDMSEADRARVLLTTVSEHLFYALAISLVLGFGIIFYFQATESPSNIILPVVMLCGVIGGFVGIQRRLRDLTIEDLKLLAGSRTYLILAPFVGGVLAILLYVIFLSGLLQGDLFPRFKPFEGAKDPSVRGFLSIFDQYADGYSAYAKLIFWCFVAGFSERFVTDVIGKFEGKAVKSIE